jgi:toxin ParE1/3/4
MSVYRLSSKAEEQLDDIWLFIARESGSVDIAIRVLEDISDRFWLLAQQPYMGRRREDLSSELRSFAAGNYVILYSIAKDDVVLIHYVFHGNQDIDSFLRR